jgi:hypothetical protein
MTQIDKSYSSEPCQGIGGSLPLQHSPTAQST